MKYTVKIRWDVIRWCWRGTDIFVNWVQLTIIFFEKRTASVCVLTKCLPVPKVAYFLPMRIARLRLFACAFMDTCVHRFGSVHMRAVCRVFFLCVCVRVGRGFIHLACMIVCICNRDWWCAVVWFVHRTKHVLMHYRVRQCFVSSRSCVLAIFYSCSFETPNVMCMSTSVIWDTIA